ncbi:MAG TPA: glucuronate isomerase, partial [Bacteroidetes bacterium]|nr:glucuronate isomerase [Bacteroidota bacterium]
KKDGFEIKVLPTFRPDKILTAEKPQILDKYLEQVENVLHKKIFSLSDLLDPLGVVIDFFHDMGCRLADHGLRAIPAWHYDYKLVDREFSAWRRSHKKMDIKTARQFNALILTELSKRYHDKGWIQQFHLGAIRNNNSRLYENLGADAGCDSIGDFPQAEFLSRFLNRMDKMDKLTKTIIYNLNPADNEVFATMAGNFQQGPVPGKIQWGSAWWFLDQKDGMEKHINTLSNMSLLSRFVGMLTDSRSFLSFPRHEYFRRILCNIIGTDVENGELPNDIQWLGKMVQDICYFNAKNYFPFDND